MRNLGFYLLILLATSYICIRPSMAEEDPCKQYEEKYGYKSCKMSENGDGKCDEETEDVVETICCCKPKKS